MLWYKLHYGRNADSDCHGKKEDYDEMNRFSLPRYLRIHEEFAYREVIDVNFLLTHTIEG